MIFEQDAGDVARFNTALAQEVEEYEKMVRQSLSVGQLLTAIEIARDGMTRFGKTPVLQQQLALAMVQTGALDAAQEVLSDLQKSERNEETLSLLGRLHKELWRRAPDPAEAAAALRKACTFYGDAFDLTKHYYPGINLAFALAAAGEFAEAEACARKVADICRAQIKRAEDKKVDGWLLATLAEALVHQGETTEAAQLYRRAAGTFQGRWRDIASMRRQAREILRAQRDRQQAAPDSWRDLSAIRRRARLWLGRAQEGEEWLDRCFDFPTVVVFSGHMIDQPGREQPRFSPDKEAAVRDEMRQHLLRIKAGFGYSSAASGGDIIFCECLLEMEAKVNLVLPCSVEAFKRQSVSFAGPEWERRFHHVLANATSCTSPNAGDPANAAAQAASSIGLVYSNRIATGMASLQAQALDLDLQAVALWNGQPGDRPGGTASVVREWERHNIRPYVIWPGSSGQREAGASEPTVAESPHDAPAGSNPPMLRQEIKAMVFAEVLNLSFVSEAQMPAFVAHFKTPLAKLMEEMGGVPTVAESWAGIHYFIYDRVEDAARFALAFRDFVRRTRWADHGLPANLGLRMVLHAGPVFAFFDPSLRRLTCVGPHVNRPGRLTALTPRGQVYVTQEFAALCGAARNSEVSFEYLGYMRTTVMFEDAALYRLDWVHDDKKVAETPAAPASGAAVKA